MSPREAAPFTLEQRAQVLRALAQGDSVYRATRQAGVKHSRFYALRRLDPQFEAAVIAAVEHGTRAGRTVAPILTAPPRIDEDRVRRLVLRALEQGATLRAAAVAAGTTPATVLRIRRDHPGFDREVVATARREGHKGPPPRRVSPAGPCSVPWCPAAKTRARGMCARHYYRWYRTGRTGPAEQTYGRRPVCQTPGCGQPHRARGYCVNCYDRNVRRQRRTDTGDR
ncbi:hypothetical protein ABT282_38450 [Streptomyces sp. NPDC000927]|uniref:hypothetical protein n=1 Tax=Streptomyces sp. NPDC000927 TaxID=3154371 RepID=UPI00332335F1